MIMKKLNIVFLIFISFLIFKLPVMAEEIKESNYGNALISDKNFSVTFNFKNVEPRTIDNLFVLDKIDVDENGNGGKTVYRMYMKMDEICDITNNIYTNCDYNKDNNRISIRIHEFNPNNYIEYRIYFFTDKIYTEIVQVVEGTTYTIANNERISSSNPDANNNEREATLLVIDGEKYVPIRLFSEVLYYDVTYYGSEKRATVDTYNILEKDNVTCSMVNKTDSYYLYNECDNKKIYIIPTNVKVYLSPSTQRENSILPGYGYTNESEIMNKFADYLGPALESKGIVVFRNQPTMSVSENAADSRSHEVDFHFAIHSNAGGGIGPEIWVHPNGTQTAYELADRIYNAVLSLYPDPSKGRGIKNNRSLAETNPANVNNGVLIEIAFHDQASDLEWMVNNFEPISNAMAQAISDYYSEYK